MNKIAFATHCSDDWFYDGGCHKLLATAAHFCPDIPFYLFSTKELNELNAKYSNKLHWDILNPVVSKEIANLAEWVIHIDADSLILGDLPSLIRNVREDVVCVRNNNDYDKASREQDPPITINNCHPEDYMNAGLIGSKNSDFWDHWIERNFSEAYKYPYKEQDILNLILENSRFDYKCLDPKTDKVHCGISSLYGTETYWDISKEIKLVNGKFMLNNKQIMVYHQAGGHRFFPKLQLEKLFSKEVADSITEIVGKTTYNVLKVKI